MAQTVTIDQVKDLQAVEREGTLRSLTREALVSGISSTNWDIITKALADANVPDYGDYITTDNNNNAATLMCVERSIIIEDKEKARVKLVYENVVDLPVNIDTPFFNAIHGRVVTNLQQKTTSKDADGNIITLSHTYDIDDPDFSEDTKEQTASYQYYEPQKTLYISGIKTSTKPWTMVNKIVGHVNKNALRMENDGVARTWLCTSVNWKIAARRRVSGSWQTDYLFDFEFQYNPDTWDPTVKFIDERWNRPPADLVDYDDNQSVYGKRTVKRLPECDFEKEMGGIVFFVG